jgi:hypothetical protein
MNTTASVTDLKADGLFTDPIRIYPNNDGVLVVESQVSGEPTRWARDGLLQETPERAHVYDRLGSIITGILGVKKYSLCIGINAKLPPFQNDEANQFVKWVLIQSGLKRDCTPSRFRAAFCYLIQHDANLVAEAWNTFLPKRVKTFLYVSAGRVCVNDPSNPSIARDLVDNPLVMWTLTSNASQSAYNRYGSFATLGVPVSSSTQQCINLMNLGRKMAVLHPNCESYALSVKSRSTALAFHEGLTISGITAIVQYVSSDTVTSEELADIYSIEDDSITVNRGGVVPTRRTPSKTCWLPHAVQIQLAYVNVSPGSKLAQNILKLKTSM